MTYEQMFAVDSHGVREPANTSPYTPARVPTPFTIRSIPSAPTARMPSR